MADLLEVHELMYPKAYLGPLDQIGFLDITDRLHSEGLYEQFNTPSLLQQSTRGHHFGLPRAVGPVLLAYRADLVEAAGISESEIEQIETWDDYFRVMRPLMVDLDGDGRPDRYLLSVSEMSQDVIRMLILQNDGVLFDKEEQPAFANERNARTLATIITWSTGEARIGTDVPLHGSAGHRQRLDGVVIGTPIPDWMLALWKRENPQIGGKIKFMPLPAFEAGGRRTSTLGDTMIGIHKHSARIEACWEMAKSLYTSLQVAEDVYRESGIITPFKPHWEASFYHEPDPFCGGQRVGSLFIEQAPHVPIRPSSPYTQVAFGHICTVAIQLRAFAEKNSIYEIEPLAAEALRLLRKEQYKLQNLIRRNVFLENHVK
ncbi:hypothetical protein AXK11_07485 [Cephaloticoccus primus]|uniref:Uncharacterized protein n=2 Tax=Cephaloticoccus primus TaxID=1548207 RepID=A0A139SK88_9BACT|nr:hypothetical protein AXK11_07485 [Cephaloticoccus primus]